MSQHSPAGRRARHNKPWSEPPCRGPQPAPAPAPAPQPKEA